MTSKSVALKTVGLTQYMFQCGLLIPVAEGAKAGVWFRLSVSYLDLSLKEPSFSFETQSGSQEGSKCEIVKVSPLPNNGILVTYEIDCKIYSIRSIDFQKASRFVGTVQVVYYHKQF